MIFQILWFYSSSNPITIGEPQGLTIIVSTLTLDF